MENAMHVVYADNTAREDTLTALESIDGNLDHVTTLADCLETLDGATCVVTECVLPDGTGAEVCERIRARAPDVPLVVFTDHGTETLAGDVVAAGADGYVPKSQGVETLVTRVVELLVDRDGKRREAKPKSALESPGTGPGVGSTVDVDIDVGEVDERSGEATGPTARLELLIDQSPLAIIEWNLEFEATSWNPAATELFGYSPAEAIGSDARELIVAEEEMESVDEYWDTLVVDGESRRGISHNVRRDGSSVTCEWFDTPLVDETGEIVSVLSFAQDVTEELDRADALETLQDTTHELMRANSVEEIGSIVAEATENVIEQPRAALRLYDEESDRLEIVATTDELRRNDAELAPIGPGGGPFWDAYERQEPIVVDDASTDIVPYDLDLSLGSVAIQPLGDHGILVVASPGDVELGVSDIHLVNVFAATVEAALDRATRQQELERTKTIVEAVGDGVYALDSAGNFVTVNDTLTAVTGYARDRLLGEHVSRVLTDESLERGTRVAGDVLEADDDYVATYELTLETCDGERLPCEITTTALRSDGEFAGTAGIVRDISDRKEMERKLRDRKRKTTNLHGTVSTLEDCETRREIYEETAEAAMGVLNFDICLLGSVQDESFVTEAVVPEECGRTTPERVPVSGIGERVYRTQQTYQTGDIEADDEIHTGEGEADAVLTAKGFQSLMSIPVGEFAVFQAASTERDAFDGDDRELAELLVSHASDALERMAFEEQLKAQRDRFAALFENVPDAVVSAHHPDDEPIVERVNPAFERIFGYEQSELVGESLDRFIVPSEAMADAHTINRRGVQGDIVEQEVKRRTTDGLRDFMMRTVPMKMDEASDRTFGVYTDITEQKQRQKRVEILNRVLRHDLRNGMNIINGCAEMLADVVEDDASAQYAEAIQERAGELIGLAEKTRAVERTLDRGDAATGPVDVVDGVETAVESIEADYPEATISCSLPERAHARADDMLQTAIFHVVENAVEHNDMPTAAIDIDLEFDHDDGTLTLSVADNGPGIPTEERELLQEEQEITQLRHASGLGLWLVNWVVTQSGGQLSFSENEPRGTVVTLEVPGVESAPSQAVHGSATALD